MQKALPKKRGRPASGKDPVTAIRLAEEMRTRLDDWCRKQDDLPSRSEAIRRLVELGLAASAPRRLHNHEAHARSSKLAHDTIDQHIDKTAPAEEQERRKRRL